MYNNNKEKIDKTSKENDNLKQELKVKDTQIQHLVYAYIFMIALFILARVYLFSW